MRVARVATSRFARQLHDPWAGRIRCQIVECGLDLCYIREWCHAAGPRAQFPRRLRSTQQQFAQYRALLRRELQCAELGVAETLLILWHATAKARLLDHQMLAT